MKNFTTLTLTLTLALTACGDNVGVDPCVAGNSCLFAGTGERGFNKDNPNADRLESLLYFPSDLTFDSNGRAYIADWNNHMIRRVELDGRITTVVGTDYEGDGPPEMEDRLPLCSPPGALGTTVAMNHPTDMKIGPDGMVYVAAWHNNKIRMFDPETNIVTAIAGNFYGYAGDGDSACNAVFNQPKGMAFDVDGTMYVIDQRNVRIRAIAPTGSRVINTFAGVGKLGNLGDGGLAIDAQFGFETGTTPRPSGGLVIDGRWMYVADSLNNRIRRISLDTGLIDCIAGNSATAGYSGDGGSAVEAQLNFPADIELGPDGRLYVADRGNNVIRAINLTSGTISTVVGNGQQCDNFNEECPVGVAATETLLNEPYGIAFDPTGNLYVADTHNSRILEVVR